MSYRHCGCKNHMPISLPFWPLTTSAYFHVSSRITMLLLFDFRLIISIMRVTFLSALCWQTRLALSTYSPLSLSILAVGVILIPIRWDSCYFLFQHCCWVLITVLCICELHLFSSYWNLAGWSSSRYSYRRTYVLLHRYCRNASVQFTYCYSLPPSQDFETNHALPLRGFLWSLPPYSPIGGTT